MNLSAEADRDKLSFSLPHEAPTSWAAFGFETGMQWFMARAVFAMEFSREQVGEKILFTTRPMSLPQGIQFSNVVSFNDLASNSKLLNKLSNRWQPPSDIGTLLNYQWDDLKADKLTIGLFSYMMADMVVDLFIRGATICRMQTSLEEAQLWANTGLTEKSASEVMDETVLNYAKSDTLEKLPWPVSV